ncbi:hypothetical protein DFJ74DRAFT_765237 [Hyaloraphidium curvatum]|nr:hypothetical protein DFJ74DRAFT_765237 [Hyaloraphidium curvatum]
MRPQPFHATPADPAFPASFLALLSLPDLSPTLPSLRALVAKCTSRIPFESMQLHEHAHHPGRPHYDGVPSNPDPGPQRVDAEPAAVWERVRRGRGGYCCELNGLVHAALRASGFRDACDGVQRGGEPWVLATAARISRLGVVGGLTHRVSLVGLPSESAPGGYDAFLVDVGYGAGAPSLPVPLDGRVVGNAQGRFRAVRGVWGQPDAGPAGADGDWFARTDDEWWQGLGRGWYVQSYLPGNIYDPKADPAFRWTSLYFFTPVAYHAPDFFEFNHYVSTFPEARFVAEEVAFRYLRSREGGAATFLRTAVARKEGGHGVLRVRWGRVEAHGDVEMDPSWDAGAGPWDEEEDEVAGLRGRLEGLERDGWLERAEGSAEGKLAFVPRSEEGKWRALEAVFGIRRLADMDG